MRLNFIFLILLPIFIITFLFWSCGCHKITIIFFLIAFDGLTGLYRSFNLGKSYSDISIITKVPIFKGFSSFMFFGIMLTSSLNPSKIQIQHENIHRTQWKEVGFFLFYILYVLEYIIRFIIHFKNPDRSNICYMSMSFEREAYGAQSITNYISYGTEEVRKPYTWMRKVFVNKNKNNVLC